MAYMLQRVSQAGFVFYRSPLLAKLGLPHAFTTRYKPGGELDFGALSLPTQGGIPPGVQFDLNLLTQTMGLEKASYAWVMQVHGSSVFVVDRAHAEEHPSADAVVTGQPGRLALIRTADCLAILLASKDGECVAAIHAGWRGLVAGIIPSAVAALTRLSGCKPQEMTAALGPCISRDHYEVSEDLALTFASCDLGTAVHREGKTKPHIDLAEAALAQLGRCGLKESCIDQNDRCTFRDADDFYSYRRQGNQAGRMISLIGPKSM